MKVCGYCCTENRDGRKNCRYCGAPLDGATDRLAHMDNACQAKYSGASDSYKNTSPYKRQGTQYRQYRPSQPPAQGNKYGKQNSTGKFIIKFIVILYILLLVIFFIFNSL